MIRRAIALSVLAVTTASAAPADDPKARAASAYAFGQTAYQAKDFATAAAKFAEAYGIDPDPVYLFNAAQAYRFGNDCQRAASYYELFLQKVPNPPNQDQITNWLADSRTCAADREEAARPPPPPSHLAAYAAGGVGAVGLGLGIGFTLHASSLANQRNQCTVANPCAASHAASLDSRGHVASVVAITSYAVAAVALGLGGFLYFRATGEHTDRAVSIAPTSGGAMVVGSFAF